MDDLEMLMMSSLNSNGSEVGEITAVYVYVINAPIINALFIF